MKDRMVCWVQHPLWDHACELRYLRKNTKSIGLISEGDFQATKDYGVENLGIFETLDVRIGRRPAPPPYQLLCSTVARALACLDLALLHFLYP